MLWTDTLRHSMHQWSQGGCIWYTNSIQQGPSQYVIPMGDGIQVTCCLCTAEESKREHNYWKKLTNKSVYAIGIAQSDHRKPESASGKAEFASGCAYKIHVPVFCEGNTRSRYDGLYYLWEACKEAGRCHQIILLQCQEDGMICSPILLAALLIWSGYSKDEAVGLVARVRIIHAGHFIRVKVAWPYESEQLFSQLSEAHEWLSRLAEDPCRKAADVTLQNHSAEIKPPSTRRHALVPYPNASTGSAVVDPNANEWRGKRSAPALQNYSPTNQSSRRRTSYTVNSIEDTIRRRFDSFVAQHMGVTDTLYNCSIDGLQTARGQLLGLLSEEEHLSAITLSMLGKQSKIPSQARMPETLLDRIVEPAKALEHMWSWSLLNTDSSKALYSLFCWTNKRVIWLASTDDGLILRSVLRCPPVVGTRFRCDIVEL